MQNPQMRKLTTPMDMLDMLEFKANTDIAELRTL